MDVKSFPMLKLMALELAIYRFPPDAQIPQSVLASPFYSVTKTAEELSIVCSSSETVICSRVERGWSCLKVEGPLDFSLTGILSSILGPLAENDISVFTVSTFDTDYVLLRSDKSGEAISALKAAGFGFQE